MKILFKAGLTAIFLFMLSFKAFAVQTAQEQNLVNMSLEDLLNTTVSSATFFKMNTREAPGTTYVVKSSQIDNSSVSTVSDILQDFVPGMYTTNHGFMGALIGSRGITTDSSSKTIYMIDGMDIDPRWHFGASEEAVVPFLGDIDRVEVTMGPGAIVHGSGAINGFINIIPKNGTDYPGWTLDTKYGFEENLSETEMGYGKSWGEGKDLYVYAAEAKSSGFTDPYNNVYNDGLGINREIFPYFKTDDTYYPDFKLAEYFRYDNFKLNTVFERSFTSPDEVWWLGQEAYHGLLAVNPEYKWDLTPQSSITDDAYMVLQDNQQIFLQNGWQYSGLQTNGTYYNVSKGDILTDVDDGNGASESYFGDNLVYRTESIDKNQIAVGMQLGRRDFYGNGFAFFWDDFGNTTGLESPHNLYNWLEYSLFAEDIVTLTDKLTMTVGGREDGVSYPDGYTSHYNNMASSIKQASIAHFSPSITFAYTVDPTTTLKTSFDQGFRFPNASDILRNLTPRHENYNAGTGPMISFPAPGPETMDSFEFDVHHDVTAMKMGLDLNTYFNMLHHTLGWEEAPDSTLGAVYNDLGFESIGCELVDKWQVFTNTSLDASYSFSRPLAYNQSLVDSYLASIVPTNIEGTKWARYPDQMIKFGATTKFFQKFTLEGDMQFRSSVNYDPVGTSGTDYTANYKWLDHPTVVFNAALKYDINRNWWIKLSVKNMFKNRNNQPIWGLGQELYAEDYSERSMTYLSVGCKF